MRHSAYQNYMFREYMSLSWASRFLVELFLGYLNMEGPKSGFFHDHI